MRDTDDIQADRWKSLGALTRRAALEMETSDAEALLQGRVRLVAEAAAGERRNRFGLRQVFVMASAALTVAAALAFGYWQLSPLRYEVYGGERYSANYVGANAEKSATVKFSDGTRVDVRPGSRLRIDETKRDGARVIIERGSARAHVQHRERSHWVFSAGPFNVHVIGTKFDIDWDSAGQVFSLALHEGAVEVESPVGQSRFTVRAGQRFVASLQTGTMTLESIQQAPARVPARAPDTTQVEGSSNPSASTESSATTAAAQFAASSRTVRGERDSERTLQSVPHPRERARPSRSHATDTWTKLVRRGDFETVVEQALAGDLAATLRQCSAADARALADAARYTDRVALAERALNAIRMRFADSDQAHAADFLLGRTSESSGKRPLADRWYATYLNEAPAGEYAADALVGRMRVLVAMSQVAAARPIAREYLRRFPNGVHLTMARRLSGEP